MSPLLTMIVPLRDGASVEHLRHPRVDLLEIRGPLESIAKGFLDGICKATTEWVILANDDITLSPKNDPTVQGWSGAPRDWVDIIEAAIREKSDPYWLFYPDDGCFGESLSIFPILNRQVVLEHLDLIPPFRRYCLDPHVFNIFRWIKRAQFLPDVLFDHQNHYTKDTIPEWAAGMKLNEGKNGRIYICKPGPDVDHDNRLAQLMFDTRRMHEVAEKLYARIQERQSITA